MREHDKMLETLGNRKVPKGENLSVQTISRDIAKLAWLAGAIEGEGCFGMYICKGHANRPRTRHDRDEVQVRTVITLVNSDAKFIKKASEVLFDFGVGFYFALRRKSSGRNMLELTVEGKGKCKRLITLLAPYLCSKLDQARLMLDLIEYREGRKEGNKSYDIMQDTRLLQGIDSLKVLKSNLVEPSTTLRRASQPLGLKI